MAAEEGEDARVEHAEEMEGDPQLEEASVKCLQCQIQCGCHGGDGRHGDTICRVVMSWKRSFVKFYYHEAGPYTFKNLLRHDVNGHLNTVSRCEIWTRTGAALWIYSATRGLLQAL